MRFLLCSLVGLIIILTVSIVPPVVLANKSRQTSGTCNGHAELCSRSYSNVTQVGAHDSPFDGTIITDDQNIDVTAQLNMGIRFLQGQTHQFLDTLTLCHTSCFLRDAGPVHEYLSTVKTWLDANPNEVLTILLTNGDNVDVSEFRDAYVAAGMDAVSYVPPSNPLAIGDWPTLQELIDGGKRVVNFLDTGANLTTAPYILDEFTYFFETPFDTTDPNFAQCTLDRPAGGSADGRMYIVNHFLDIDLGDDILIPDEGAAGTTNAVSGNGSIGAQAALCESIYGRPPNFVLCDWVDKGDVIAAQDGLNGL